MSMLFFKEQLDLIVKVTEMLNKSEIPESASHHVKVLLMETDTETVVGVWDDEISSEDWALELGVDQKDKNTK